MTNSPDHHLLTPRQRMLSARDRVRGYFSSEVIAGSSPDDAEVIGQTAAGADREVRVGR